MSEGTFFVTYDLSAGLQLTSVDESGFLFDSVFFRFFFIGVLGSFQILRARIV